jgi:uncharacterized protein YggE
MNGRRSIAALLFLASSALVSAQQANQLQLKIDSTNRTLTVSAEERVTADPELAILHIGFQTPPSDAKTAYAAGAKISNDIVAALKQAGIPETSIRSERQSLDSVDAKAHKFRLSQSWTVKAPPERAAEILDVAIGAGATDSGQIDWTVQDVQALEDKALDHASVRAHSDAGVLAKASGVQLGRLLYITNQVTEAPAYSAYSYLNESVEKGRSSPVVPPLAIEPRKVSRTARVYAVYAIE